MLGFDDPLRAQLALMEELQARRRKNKISEYFPDTGPLRRELYAKHLLFFEAGAKFRERALLAGNRIGKSEAGACEMTYHLTGLYPAWWKGRRFPGPVNAWACGDTTQTVRDIAQTKLLGPHDAHGTGLIPGRLITDIKPKSGSVPYAIEMVGVKHTSGGVSNLTFKTYEQGRKSFQGTHQDVIWLDEECPEDVYEESLFRTMDTHTGNGPGTIYITFTPLMGLTPVVLAFLPGGQVPEDNRPIEDVDNSKFLVMAGWDDAPHLGAEEKALMIKACRPHQRKARSQGIPQLGAGAIYPIPEEDIVVDDIVIPDFWPRAYALDVGWKATAALWGAIDRETDCVYFYAAYKRGQAEPAIHAAAIRAKGDWIPGVIDPASRGRSQVDGTQLIQVYEDAGLVLSPAINAVEAGIDAVYSGLSIGKIKVFRSLQPFLEEYRIYRRDEKGRVVKENDHLMDCARYFIMSGKDVAITDKRKHSAETWRTKLKTLFRQQQQETAGYRPGTTQIGSASAMRA